MSRLEAIGVSYAVDGIALVDEVGLTIEPGEILGLAGPNGAGKTTLVRLLAGELKPDAGTVTLEGAPLAEFSTDDLARRRAVLPQLTIVQFAFSVLDVVMMGRYPHRGHAGAAEDDRAVETAMRATDVDSLSQRVYPTLSGGEQNRVSLARVLAQETPLVMLDEPTASLDLRHQELIMAAMRGIADGGGSVLAVFHDLNMAARYTDRLILMSEGAVAAAGPTAAVLEQDLLSRVYDTPIAVVPHPFHDCPLVLVR